MRIMIATLTALMLFVATPVVAGDTDDEAIQALEAAKARLAVILAQEAFDERNFPKAFRLNKPLAEQGLPSVKYNLGYMYAQGEIIPDDYVKAYAWYSIVAPRGDDIVAWNGKYLRSSLEEELVIYKRFFLVALDGDDIKS